MKILVWDAKNEATEKFLEMAQKYADIDLFEDLMDLSGSVESGDIAVFDLDTDTKLVEKTLKKIKKSSVDIALVVLTNNLASKEMAKHQKSKHGADIYLRSPVDEKLFINMVRPFVGRIDLLEEVENEQIRSIISEHQASDDIGQKSAQAQSINAELDAAFRLAMGDSGESARALEQIKEQEIIEASLNEIELEEGDEDLMDLGEDDPPSEELDMSDDSLKDDSIKLDEEGLDLESLELDAGDELDLGVEGELSLDSLEDDSASDVSLDEGGLELGADDAGELSLGDEEPEALDLGDENGALSLSDSDEMPLEIGEDTQAKELAADDGLELGEDLDSGLSDELSLDGNEDELQYDDDNSKMFDLEAAQEESGDDLVSEELSIEEDSGSDELDLGDEDNGSVEFSLGAEGADNEDFQMPGDDDLEELNLSGEEETLDDSELFGAPVEDDPELSADSLPDSPDLGPQKKSNSDMSQHALEQLAQIDEIMKRDASQIRKGLKPDATREIDLKELQDSSQSLEPEQDLNAATEGEDLVAQLHAEVEEEDYDPTADQENANLEGLFTSSPEVTSTAIQTSPAIAKVEAASPKLPQLDPDAEKTIKEQKSALMRHEDELMRLGATIKNLREDREELTRQIEALRENNESEKRDYDGLRAQLDEKRIELEVSRKRASKQVEEMRYRAELSEDKARALEEKLKALEFENEKLRGKANIDVGRVRARERELENKLELLKADTETQIRNRDIKILELKRKIDTLEFDIESIQLKERKTVDNNYAMEERMDRVINTLRRAIGELESEDAPIRNLEALKKNLDV